MAGETILRIGPVESGPNGENHYLLIDADGVPLAEEQSSEDVVGIRSLVVGRDRPPTCEPALSAAAATLGLAISEPTREQNEAKADAAIALAGEAVPQTTSPMRRRTFLQGMGVLLESPSWQRLGDEETAVISVLGCFETENFELGISLARVPGADPDKLLVMVTDFAVGEDEFEACGMTEIAITFGEAPLFLVQALEPAFLLKVMPHVEVDGAPIQAGLFGRLGPALGAACYALSDLGSEDERLTVKYDSDLGAMHLQVSAGFGMAGAESMFG